MHTKATFCAEVKLKKTSFVVHVPIGALEIKYRLVLPTALSITRSTT
jgi:hypothetical protein